MNRCSYEQELCLLLSLGCVSLTVTPYVKDITKKLGISKEQFQFLKLHYKQNGKNALHELCDALKLQVKERSE